MLLVQISRRKQSQPNYLRCAEYARVCVCDTMTSETRKTFDFTPCEHRDCVFFFVGRLVGVCCCADFIRFHRTRGSSSRARINFAYVSDVQNICSRVHVRNGIYLSHVSVCVHTRTIRTVAQCARFRDL